MIEVKFYKAAQGMLVACVCVLFVATSVNAVPELQLDAEGGAYVGAPEETVFVSGDEFVIYALAKKDETDLADKHFLSIAMVPQTGPTNSVWGSFDYKINSTNPSEANITVDVTAGMTYGIPPLEGMVATMDDDDLGSHNIFETFFLEVEFMFDANRTTTSYNSKDDPGGTLGGLDDSGDDLYYMPFSFDRSMLVDITNLHFDLYSIKSENSHNDYDDDDDDSHDDHHGHHDEDILKFASFSHDAQTGSGPGGGNGSLVGAPFGSVPEPITATMGILAIAALSTTLRRRR